MMNRSLVALPLLAACGIATPLHAQAPESLPGTASHRTLASIDPLFPAAALDAAPDPSPGSAAARLAAPPTSNPAPAALPLPKYGGWVGVTKWFSLATATGLGTLGFVLHNKASDRFDQLERRCNADPDNCRALNPDGSYADPGLERLFQEIVDRDNQARLSLLGAEVSFGLSVLLFIVDFQKERGPSDIPYRPDEGKQSLQVDVRPGQFAVRYYLN